MDCPHTGDTFEIPEDIVGENENGFLHLVLSPPSTGTVEAKNMANIPANRQPNAIVIRGMASSCPHLSPRLRSSTLCLFASGAGIA